MTKTTLASSWLSVREQLDSALLTRQALPLGQICVIPFCEEEACSRYFNCSLCKNHIKIVHAGGRSLRHQEVWKVLKIYGAKSPLVTFSIIMWNPISCVLWPLRSFVCKSVVLWFNFSHPSFFFLASLYITSTQLLNLP